jgi:hypothetical protein
MSELATCSDPVEFIMRQAQEATGLSREELMRLAEEEARKPREPLVPPMTAAERARRCMLSSGVPGLYVQCVADAEPIAYDALKAVQAFAADDSLGVLVVSGGVGTYKTGSACWLLGQHEGEYVEAPDLLAIAIEDKPRYLRLRRARFAVLDDLGTEIQDAGGWWLKTFNTLFNGWYSGLSKVVITCNLTPEQFKGAYGERIVDRIRERGRWVDIGGESGRKRP